MDNSLPALHAILLLRMNDKSSTNLISLPLMDDWHLHLRDAPYLEAHTLATARYCRRALIMPNLVPPVTTTDIALRYKQRIVSALKKSAEKHSVVIPHFEPFMTLYLTDNTTPEEIYKAKQHGILAVKLYPAGATTNSSSGVTDLARLHDVLLALEQTQMPLCVHGETTDPSIDIFDRERAFVEEVAVVLVRRYPLLRLVLEHITTQEAADFVVQCNEERWASETGRLTVPRVVATLTPQHLLYNRNALFQGGLQPHMFCLPVLKTEADRTRLVELALSGTCVCVCVCCSCYEIYVSNLMTSTPSI